MKIVHVLSKCAHFALCWCGFFGFCFISVPNVSFRVYAPGFFARFMESHAVMFQGNAGLKPKEGEVTSRPWQWPINYRVSAFVWTIVFFSLSLIWRKHCMLYCYASAMKIIFKILEGHIPSPVFFSTLSLAKQNFMAVRYFSFRLHTL